MSSLLPEEEEYLDLTYRFASLTGAERRRAKQLRDWIPSYRRVELVQQYSAKDIELMRRPIPIQVIDLQHGMKFDLAGVEYQILRTDRVFPQGAEEGTMVLKLVPADNPMSKALTLSLPYSAKFTINS